MTSFAEGKYERIMVKFLLIKLNRLITTASFEDYNFMLMEQAYSDIRDFYIPWKISAYRYTEYLWMYLMTLYYMFAFNTQIQGYTVT